MEQKKEIYTEWLVMRCQAGDKTAFDELVALWQRSLYYYVHRLIENEDDLWQVLQEIWLAVIKGIPKIRRPKVFATWVYRIAHLKVLDYLREKYADEAALIGEQQLEAVQDKERITLCDDVQQLHEGLSRLSPIHREILTLFFLNDLSITAISQVLDISVGTVKSRLHYAKKALKTILEQENIEHERKK